MSSVAMSRVAMSRVAMSRTPVRSENTVQVGVRIKTPGTVLRHTAQGQRRVRHLRADRAAPCRVENDEHPEH
jgi:hypothetical protein